MAEKISASIRQLLAFSFVFSNVEKHLTVVRRSACLSTYLYVCPTIRLSTWLFLLLPIYPCLRERIIFVNENRMNTICQIIQHLCLKPNNFCSRLVARFSLLLQKNGFLKCWKKIFFCGIKSSGAVLDLSFESISLWIVFPIRVEEAISLVIKIKDLGKFSFPRMVLDLVMNLWLASREYLQASIQNRSLNLLCILTIFLNVQKENEDNFQ